MPEFVQERAPVRLSSVRTEHQVHLVGNSDGRAERAGPLAGAIAGVEPDVTGRRGIDAHFLHLALPLGMGAGKGGSQLLLREHFRGLAAVVG